MISIKHGRVKEIIKTTKEKTIVLLNIGTREEKAVNYNFLTGDISINDEVVINTTAVELKLGTGGYHFVIYNKNNTFINQCTDGHIMKLRYTPFQLKVFAAEEQDSPYHAIFHRFESLKNMPVIVGTLHSMLTPIAATLKYIQPSLKISYIMTDAAALPIYFSDSVYTLKDSNLIDYTITLGHAFGGDFETVNIYNALIIAREIAKSDIAIVCMGPGIVGTGTPYGFTGIEQGQILDAVNDLGGRAIGVPRVSFADTRERHRGVSHHSLTVFSKIAKTTSDLVIHTLPYVEKKMVYQQMENLKISQKHNIIEVDGGVLSKALKKFDLTVKSMGRSFVEDDKFFLTCSAAAVHAHNILSFLKGGI